MLTVLIPLMIMNGWRHADDRIIDRTHETEQPVIIEMHKPEPPQIEMPVVPKPVQTITVPMQSKPTVKPPWADGLWHTGKGPITGVSQ